MSNSGSEPSSSPRRELENTVGERRRERGLTATALAERVGISRQALAAIEAGRSVPSTAVALRLAGSLSCPVEALFKLPADRVEVGEAPASEARVVLGCVGGDWVAHEVPAGSATSADGVRREDGTVELLENRTRLEQTVLVSGCAPVLGALAHLVEAQGSGARWLHRSSAAALEDLALGRTHVAGLHLAAADSPETHDRIVRERLPGIAVDVVGLVGWREGLAVVPGNPLGLSGVADLARPGVRVGRRPPGAGAALVMARGLEGAGLAQEALTWREVGSHVEAAMAILHGAVDAAVLVEPVALAYGLPFMPLSEERFELVVRSRDRDHPGVARFLEGLAGSRFRRDVQSMDAYDLGCLGDTRRLGAA